MELHDAQGSEAHSLMAATPEAPAARTKLTIVVIGTGVIGRKHVDTILKSPDWRLAGIAEPADTGRDYATRLGVSWQPAAADLLGEVKPDAAIIATPTDTHREVALACIDRGIPALIEKPIAGSLEDAAAIVAASERAGVPVLVGHHRRYNPIIRCARQMMAEGCLGRLTNATVLYTFYKPPEYFDVGWRLRSGGGPILINLIHEVDLIRHLCGEIESVQALASNATRGFALEDTAAALLRLANGALVTLNLSDTAVAPWSWDLATNESELFPPQPGPVHTHFLSGTRGSLTLPTLEHWRYPSNRSWLLPIHREAISSIRADPFSEQLQHLGRVVRGEAAPFIPASEGALTLRATLAIHKAARNGETVALEVKP
jgi:predicted dehydrogenase